MPLFAATIAHSLPAAVMLTRIQAHLPFLSKSERTVAEWVLANPRAALDQDTRSLAQLMDVSQPTLVRFAQSMGCTGFQDFKLRLAQSMGAAGEQAPTTLASIAASSDADSLCRSLFDFTLQALAQVRDNLDRDSLDRAIRLLDGAARVTFFGFGNTVTVAQDAMRRFMRLEMQPSACTDPYLQSLVAAQMHKGDVVVVLSRDGRTAEILETVAAVRSQGGAVLALTMTGSPLQEAANLSLCIDVPDSGDALTPSMAQLAELAVIDLLMIGVASRRSARITRRAQRTMDAAKR